MRVPGAEKKRKRGLQLDDDGKPVEVARENESDVAANPQGIIHDLDWYLPKPRVGERARPVPPRRPFVTGIIRFPFYQESLACWLMLSVTFGLAVPLLVVAVRSFSGILSAGGLGAGLSVAATAMLTAMIASFTVPATLIVAAVKFLTILQDTSEGYDRIETRSEGPWIDWATESFYVLNAASLCMAPGWLLYELLSPHWEFAWLVVPVGAMLFFPVLLLSMLSAASPLAALTATVLRMLLRVWWAWLLFFLQSTVVIAVAVAVTWGLMRLMGTWGISLACVIDVPLAMIYFRLLGRLAWCCKQAYAADIKRQAVAEAT
jgi:hypothetical protein